MSSDDYLVGRVIPERVRDARPLLHSVQGFYLRMTMFGLADDSLGVMTRFCLHIPRLSSVHDEYMLHRSLLRGIILRMGSSYGW